MARLRQTLTEIGVARPLVRQSKLRFGQSGVFRRVVHVADLLAQLNARLTRGIVIVVQSQIVVGDVGDVAIRLQSPQGRIALRGHAGQFFVRRSGDLRELLLDFGGRSRLRRRISGERCRQRDQNGETNNE